MTKRAAIKAARKLRVLTLMQANRVPPDNVHEIPEKEFNQYRTDYDVLIGLEDLGHEVLRLGLGDEMLPLRNMLAEAKPHVVFNLADAFRGLPTYDTHVVHYLELMRAAYTGCNPRGLILARDKALSKKILHYHRVPTPRFAVFRRRRKTKRPRWLSFPLIVKPLSYEGSTGIARASVVNDDEALQKRVTYIHEALECAAIVEQFIAGREVYVGVIGNRRVQALPIWELYLDKLPDEQQRIATYSAKWDLDYQQKHDIHIGPARKLSEDVERRLHEAAKRIYRILGLSGYARLDFRLRDDGAFFLLEANPNPDIASEDEFAQAALASGLQYEALLQKVLNLGLRWHDEHFA